MAVYGHVCCVRTASPSPDSSQLKRKAPEDLSINWGGGSDEEGKEFWRGRGGGRGERGGCEGKGVKAGRANRD